MNEFYNKEIKKRAFLKEIDNNEELLNMLSIDRLKKLEKYYEEMIDNNNKILKKT